MIFEYFFLTNFNNELPKTFINYLFFSQKINPIICSY